MRSKIYKLSTGTRAFYIVRLRGMNRGTSATPEGAGGIARAADDEEASLQMAQKLWDDQGYRLFREIFRGVQASSMKPGGMQ